MVCGHYIIEFTPYKSPITGKVTYQLPSNKRIDHTPYSNAICNVEKLLTKIVCYPTRNMPKGHKSWVLNKYLNNSWFTKYYWRIKKFVFRSDMVMYE